MSKILKTILCCCVFVAIMASCIGCGQSISEFYYENIYKELFQTFYTASGVDSYGIIEGNRNNKPAEEIFATLFPPQIKDSFQGVTYHYKAASLDAWSYEIYLEFVLEDVAEFQDYINGIAPTEEWFPFEYDETYLVYTYSDWYAGGKSSEGDYYNVDSAAIEKVIINQEEQRVITVALGAGNGGAMRADDFTCFFDRFHIDPVEYMKRPDYNHEDILNGEHLTPNQGG